MSWNDNPFKYAPNNVFVSNCTYSDFPGQYFICFVSVSVEKKRLFCDVHRSLLWKRCKTGRGIKRAADFWLFGWSIVCFLETRCVFTRAFQLRQMRFAGGGCTDVCSWGSRLPCAGASQSPRQALASDEVQELSFWWLLSLHASLNRFWEAV